MAFVTRTLMALFAIMSVFVVFGAHARPIPSHSMKLRGFDAIYQFGDSLSDTGNLMLEGIMKGKPRSFCANKPYGETLGNNPTGRCSNGLLMVDYFANEFNVPLLNPYLQSDADFSHGVNFAVAGATVLDDARYTPANPTNSSLPIQLGWFRDHMKFICSSVADCKRKFERALFIVGEVGGNDYNYFLLAGKMQSLEDRTKLDVQKLIKDAQKLTPEVVQAISDAVEELISHGARVVMVPGNFPIGCMPVYLTAFGNDTTQYDKFGCLGEFNGFAIYHNKHLNEAIDKLKAKHPEVEIYYGDYFDGLRSIIKNAASLGFDSKAVFQPCCGTGIDHPCWSDSPTLCSDPSTRVSWDGIHLTQKAYQHLAGSLLNSTFLHEN